MVVHLGGIQIFRPYIEIKMHYMRTRLLEHHIVHLNRMQFQFFCKSLLMKIRQPVTNAKYYQHAASDILVLNILTWLKIDR